MSEFFKKNYSVIITVFLFLALELPFLESSRPIMTDEAWYSNPAYNLVATGTISNTSIGYGGSGLVIYSFYIALYIFIFGVSLFTSRLSSLVLGVIAIFLFRKMLKVLEISEFDRLITLLFFIFANLYLSIFKLARPEALAVVFSLCLLLVTYYYIISSYSFKYLLLFILFSFLSINSHPNSSIIISVSFLVILFYLVKEKQYKKVFQLIPVVLGIFASVFFLVWAIAFCNSVNINSALGIMSDRNTINTSFISLLKEKITSSIEYFVVSSRSITFIPQIFLLFTGLFYKNKNKLIFILSLSSFASLFVALVFLSPSGFIYVYPYVFLFSALILSLMLKQYAGSGLKYNIILIAVVSIVIFNIVAYVVLTKKTLDFGMKNNIKEIEQLIPEKSLVVSEAPFWFIAPEKEIKTLRYFKEKNISLKDKNFYILNSDKFSKEFRSDSNSIAFLDVPFYNYKIDTLIVKSSVNYGNIYLIRYTGK